MSSSTTAESRDKSTRFATDFVLNRWFLPGVLCIGMSLRLAIVFLLPMEPVSDGEWYLQRARELLQGLGYQEGGYPTAYWPVGYPALLAASMYVFGNEYASYVIPNLLSTLAIMWMILWLGRKLTQTEWVARIACLAYALYPNHIMYANQSATETVYTALYMGAFALLIACRHKAVGLLFSGLLFGVATLVKAQTILFPLGCLIVLWWAYADFKWIQAAKAALVVYVGLLAIVLPWSERNAEALGKFVMVSTNGGVALMIGANELATGDHLEIAKTPLMEKIGIPWEQRVERQLEWDARHKELAMEWIRENPWSYLALAPKKILLLWIKDTDGFWAASDSRPNSIKFIRLAQWLNQIYYLSILALSMPCAWFASKALLLRDVRTSQMTLLFCMPIFVTLLAAVFTGQIRYHFPAMPMIMIGFAWSLSWLQDLRSKGIDFSQSKSR